MRHRRQHPIIAIHGSQWQPRDPRVRARAIAVATISRRGNIAEERFSGVLAGTTFADLISPDFGKFGGVVKEPTTYRSAGDLWAGFAAHVRAEMKRCPGAMLVSLDPRELAAYCELWNHPTEGHPDVKLHFGQEVVSLRAAHSELDVRGSLRHYVDDKLGQFETNMWLRDPAYFAAAATALAMRKTIHG